MPGPETMVPIGSAYCVFVPTLGFPWHCQPWCCRKRGALCVADIVVDRDFAEAKRGNQPPTNVMTEGRQLGPSGPKTDQRTGLRWEKIFSPSHPQKSGWIPIA